MIRCIAIDLDDTLLQDDLSISVADENAVRRAIEHGVKIVLASGRMLESMQPYIRKLGIDLPVIAYNGAVIQEPLSGKTLYCHPVPQELAARVIPIFQAANIHLNLYLHGRLYIRDKTKWSEQYAASAGVTPHPAGDLLKILTDSPPKLLGIAEPDEINRMHQYLQQEFAAVLDFTKSKPNYLEILAAGVSKGRALEFLARKWGYEPNQIMAIGDAPNDLSMISWAGMGVAIGNAIDAVKQQADLIVSDNNHHGVAEAIDQVLTGTVHITG